MREFLGLNLGTLSWQNPRSQKLTSQRGGIAERLLSMPPKPHKEMKLGKRKPKSGAKADWPKKAPLQLDAMRIGKIVSGLILAAYLKLCQERL